MVQTLSLKFSVGPSLCPYPQSWFPSPYHLLDDIASERLLEHYSSRWISTSCLPWHPPSPSAVYPSTFSWKCTASEPCHNVHNLPTPPGPLVFPQVFVWTLTIWPPPQQSLPRWKRWDIIHRFCSPWSLGVPWPCCIQLWFLDLWGGTCLPLCQGCSG